MYICICTGSACDCPTCLVCRMSGGVPVPALAHLCVRTFQPSRFRPNQPSWIPQSLACSLNSSSHWGTEISTPVHLRHLTLKCTEQYQPKKPWNTGFSPRLCSTQAFILNMFHLYSLEISKPFRNEPGSRKFICSSSSLFGIFAFWRNSGRLDGRGWEVVRQKLRQNEEITLTRLQSTLPVPPHPTTPFLPIPASNRVHFHTKKHPQRTNLK